MTTEAETERLIHYMPILVQDADVNDWERTFCASIIHKSRRPGFTASEKQIAVMKRMVDKFQNRIREEPGEVIE